MLRSPRVHCADGRCFRQYSLPRRRGDVGRMDLRPFIDQGRRGDFGGVHVPQVTGDRGFLDESGVPRDRRRGRAASSRESEARPRPGTPPARSWITCVGTAIRRRDCVRRHMATGTTRWTAWYQRRPCRTYGSGCERYGDAPGVSESSPRWWNCFCEDAARQSRSGSPRYDAAAARSREGLKRYASRSSNPAAEQRILHGWGDGRSYLVGSFNDPDGAARDGLTSNAFWVLSGMFEEDPRCARSSWPPSNGWIRSIGLQDVRAVLSCRTRPASGVSASCRPARRKTARRTCTRRFSAWPRLRWVARASAWEQMVKVLPFHRAARRTCRHSPFVMPNSYGLQPGRMDRRAEHERLADRQRQRAFKLLIRHVFGFEPLTGGRVDSARRAGCRSAVRVHHRARGCNVRISYRDESRGGREFTVGAVPRPSSPHPIVGVPRIWISYDEFRKGTLEIGVTD